MASKQLTPNAGGAAQPTIVVSVASASSHNIGIFWRIDDDAEHLQDSLSTDKDDDDEDEDEEITLKIIGPSNLSRSTDRSKCPYPDNATAIQEMIQKRSTSDVTSSLSDFFRRSVRQDRPSDVARSVEYKTERARLTNFSRLLQMRKSGMPHSTKRLFLLVLGIGTLLLAVLLMVIALGMYLQKSAIRTPRTLPLLLSPTIDPRRPLKIDSPRHIVGRFDPLQMDEYSYD